MALYMHQTFQQVLYWCMKVEPEAGSETFLFLFFFFFFSDHLSLSQPSPACVCGQEVSTPPPLSVHLHRMRRRRKQWVTTWSKEQSIKPPTRHEIIIPHRKPGVPDGLRSQETGDWWLDKWRELRKPFICFCFWRSLFTHRSWAVVPPSQSKVSECLMTWRDVFSECLA